MFFFRNTGATSCQQTRFFNFHSQISSGNPPQRTFSGGRSPPQNARVAAGMPPSLFLSLFLSLLCLASLLRSCAPLGVQRPALGGATAKKRKRGRGIPSASQAKFHGPTCVLELLRLVSGSEKGSGWQEANHSQGVNFMGRKLLQVEVGHFEKIENLKTADGHVLLTLRFFFVFQGQRF